ncbi:hypothetical protein PG993_002278 [Apiospora rasikravindrae]|uniref:Uncharacterized protein n=1 Tax=Apiospora rasikravindrae TaxID=990691 RepID=A0ABR1TW82_9PEZI
MAFYNVFAALLLFLVHPYNLVAASSDGLQISTQNWPSVPGYGPQPNAPYMVDNRHNYFNSSPNKGTQDGAVWQYSGSFDNFMENLRAGQVIRGGDGSGLKPTDNGTSALIDIKPVHPTFSLRSDSSSYWLTKLGPLGSQPLAGSGYKFFRNVVDDYKADNSGNTDTTESINAAIQDGSRCGKDCGNTFTKGAIIYFPSGTYKICSPIIQLYYTQFIGDPNDPPVIKGCDTFKGIALIDTDPYIPRTYINENQFFRHIRNFVFDLTDMPLATTDNSQPYVPTGLHWQAAQANLVFNMPNATDVNSTNHVGIFMENGSGGFVSGSQQYTARSLKFHGCLTSVQMVWDWGFNWQNVEIDGGAVGFNISGRGGDKGQGTGSVSIIDCTIKNVPKAVLTNGLEGPPNIVLDNLHVNNVGDIVVQDDNHTLLNEGPGPYTVNLWAAGMRYVADEGFYRAGPAYAPPKGAGLLDKDGKLFVRSRPEYENVDSSSFLVATNEGISNDGSGDQAGAINAFLEKAASANQIAYFPAGIYQVGSTVLVPTGSRVQGSSWSQIQGAGVYFADMHNPKVMVQVGNKGDVGNMEIVEMLFTVAGPTAGAILMEWNVAAATQGSAAMWDSHFRVGGATGTDLDVEHCPKSLGINRQCIAASLMFHVTQQASGYFENVWAWVGVFGGRGILVESEGPSWFYGSGSEHSVLYNYQFYNAKNIYIGHLQTETPYFQPEPVAPHPFAPGKSFASDPTFDDCTSDICRMSWGLRIIDSNNITVHGAGLYSFFNNYEQNCTETYDCQERILEVQNSNRIAIMNLFTVASTDIALGSNGFTTEVNIWLPLNGQVDPEVVYVGPEIWATPSIACSPPCILVLPTSPLSSSSTIDPGDYTTSLEYGSPGTTTAANGQVITTFIITTTVVTIDIPLLTIGAMPYYNLNVTSTATGGGFVAEPSVDIPPVGVPLPDGKGGTTTRSLTLPPWPKVSQGPPDGPGWEIPGDPFGDDRPQQQQPPTPTTRSIRTMSFFTPFRTSLSIPSATLPTDTLPGRDDQLPTCHRATVCHAQDDVDLPPDLNTAFTLRYKCPEFPLVTFLGPFEGFYDVDCSFITAWNWPLTPRPSVTSDPLSLPAYTMTFPPGVGDAPTTAFTLGGYGGGDQPITLTLGQVKGSLPPYIFTLPHIQDTSIAPGPMTITYPPGIGGVQPTVLTIGEVGGGAPPATINIEGAPGGVPQSSSLTFGGYWPGWFRAPATTITLAGGYDPTTVTLGAGTGLPEATTMTIWSKTGLLPVPTPITLIDAGGAEPTILALTGQATTMTFGGGWFSWGAWDTDGPATFPTAPPPPPEIEPQATVMTFGPGFQPTTLTLGEGNGEASTFVLTGPSQSTTITLEGGQGAPPTTIPITQPTTVTLPGGIGFWGMPPATPTTGLIKFPEIGPFKIKGDLPPWPKITIGLDKKLTYSDSRSTDCKTQTADLCQITTSVIVEASKTSRSTITGDCAPIKGCSATDSDVGVTATSIAPTSSPGSSTTSSTSSTSSSSSSGTCQPTASADKLVCMNDAFVYPKDPANVGEIPDLLTNYTGKYQTIGAAGEVGIYWVPALEYETYEILLESPDVDGVDYYEEGNAAGLYPDDWAHVTPPTGPIVSVNSSMDNSSMLQDDSISRLPRKLWNMFWETSVPSLPINQTMCSPTSHSCRMRLRADGVVKKEFAFYSDDEGGFDTEVNDGWPVYIVNEPAGPWTNHTEFGFSQLVKLENDVHLNNPLNPPPLHSEMASFKFHPSGVIARINGLNFGTCKRCKAIWVEKDDWSNWPTNRPRNVLLLELWSVYADVLKNKLQNKAVLNMSFGVEVLKRLDALGVVLVVSAGNDASTDGKTIRCFPQLFGSPDSAVNRWGHLKNLIIVGATDFNGCDTSWGQVAPFMTTFAPGEDVGVPADPAQNGWRWDMFTYDFGTSFAAPQVAGIAAYLRSLPGPFHQPLKDPANVKKMISVLSHRYNIMLDDGSIFQLDPWNQRPVAWNGQVTYTNHTSGRPETKNCLTDWDTRLAWDWRGSCKGLDPNMANMGPGQPVTGCATRYMPKHRRDGESGDNLDSCPVDPMEPGAHSLTFSSASVAQPTCSAAGGCGGTVCSGYYCAAHPTEPPPDHHDPQDPNNGKPVPSSTVTRSWSTAPPAPTDLTSWVTSLESSTTSTKTTRPVPITVTVTTPAPPNSVSPSATCAATDDKCKVDLGYPCHCDDDGCDEWSPDCCASKSCPVCACFDGRCTSDSPKCCPDNCAWSWTGGSGGDKTAVISHILHDRLASMANSSAGSYSLWSHANDTGSWNLAGYNGRLTPARVCTETPAWSPLLAHAQLGVLGLQTWYANMTVFNDTCSYLSGVANYSSVAAGVKVGALTCTRWATADCYRANHTDAHDCGTGKVAEELVCQW